MILYYSKHEPGYSWFKMLVMAITILAAWWDLPGFEGLFFWKIVKAELFSTIIGEKYP